MANLAFWLIWHEWQKACVITNCPFCVVVGVLVGVCACIGIGVVVCGQPSQTHIDVSYPSIVLSNIRLLSYAVISNNMYV